MSEGGDSTGRDAVKARLEAAEEVAPFELDAKPFVPKDGKARAPARAAAKKKTARPSAEPADDDDDGAAGDPEDGGRGRNLSDEELAALEACAKLDQNDRDNARRLDIWEGRNLAYVAGMGWLTWRETHWKRDEGELNARLMAMNIVDRIKLEPSFIEMTKREREAVAAGDRALDVAADERDEAQKAAIAERNRVRQAHRRRRESRHKFAVSTGNAGRTGSMLQQAASIKQVDQDVLDVDRWAFNLKSGTLRFRRVPDPECPDPEEIRLIGEVVHDAHDRADRITKCASVAYDPDATCPQWLAFLAKVQPDPGMRTFLQVFHAYAMLLGGNDEQKLGYHYGQGANGKSLFLETLGRLGGDYRAVVSPDTITGDTNRQGQQASPDIARLFNTRLVTVEELPRGTPLRENLIKAVSGGTKMTARFLQKEIFEFEPMFTAVMTGNDMPVISGTDHGIWRRVLLVKWGVTIPREEQRPFGVMLEVFDAERPGILNWLLDGLKLYLEQGLEPFVPAEVTAFTQSYREDRDPVGMFIEVCTERAEGEKVQARMMFKAYEDWCHNNGMKPWSETAFGNQLRDRGIEKEKGRVRYYLDVRLTYLPSADMADPPADQPGDPGADPPPAID